jgi:catechol 2,3-dioxygenase-like lactoylglutathione lyase family enzyme
MNIDHVGFGIINFKESREFYSKVLGTLGLSVLMEGENWAMIGKAKCDFWFGEIVNETPNPIHLAFVAENHQLVNEFYRLAIEMGAKDNGKPDFNPEYGENYYASFVIDLNGHNLEVVCRKEI